MRAGKINGARLSVDSQAPHSPKVGDIWYRYTPAGKLLSLLYWTGTKWVTPDQELRRVESVIAATGFVGRLSIPGISGHILNVFAWGFAGTASLSGADSYTFSVTNVKPANYTFNNFQVTNNTNYHEIEAAAMTSSPAINEGIGSFRFTGTKGGSASSTYSIDGSFFVRYRYEYSG